MDALLQPLLQELLNNVKEPAINALGYRTELQTLRNNLRLIEAILCDTSKVNNSSRMILQTISSQLRNLMREADDVLTECRIGEEYAAGVLFGVGNWTFRLQMGGKLKDINRNIRTLLENHNLASSITARIHSSNSSEHNHNNNSGEMRSTRILPQSEVIVGLEGVAGKIKRWILEGYSYSSMIGIVGMGGMGKTTLVKKIFDDPQVCSACPNRIWVTVSNDFNQKDMLCRILARVGVDPGVHDDENELLDKICQQLKGKSYLLVLDDVWSNGISRLKSMCSYMPMSTDGKSICCIMVTTRNEEVATGLNIQRTRIHKHRELEEEDCLLLFRRHAFPRNKKDSFPDGYEVVGEKIVRKCGGLPLAIKTIAASLQNKPASDWLTFYERFPDKIAEVKDCLRLSYLPVRLKQCLLSFSIFPEDAEIEAEQLIRWWVGESLIQHKFESSETATEKGYEYLSELAARCLIDPKEQTVFGRRLYKCKMHDMVRELSMQIAQEEGFCKFGQDFPSVKPQWLGLTDQAINNEYVWDPMLRALLLVSPTTRFNLVMDRKLKSLRVLDLSHYSNQIKLSRDRDLNNFWGWITSLQLLVCLNLSGMEGLTELPSSVQKLRNLQLLIVRECKNLKHVHPSITSHLKKLVVVDLRSCPELTYLPRGLRSFSNLEELSGFTISDESRQQSCLRFADLKNLSNLRVLRISVSLDKSAISSSGDELSALQHLGQLKVLAINSIAENSKTINTVEFGAGHIYTILDRLSPPLKLKELHLKNYRQETLWSWINPTKLPELTYLSIEQGNLTSLSIQTQTWKSIEGLCIKHLPKLTEKWETLRQIMPSMRSAEVSYCNMLQELPPIVKELGFWIKDDDDYEQSATQRCD